MYSTRCVNSYATFQAALFDVCRSAMGVWAIAVIFVVVFGGIHAGLFTPPEGAAVDTFGTMIDGLACRELTLAGTAARC